MQAIIFVPSASSIVFGSIQFGTIQYENEADDWLLQKLLLLTIFIGNSELT